MNSGKHVFVRLFFSPFVRFGFSPFFFVYIYFFIFTKKTKTSRIDSTHVMNEVVLTFLGNVEMSNFIEMKYFIEQDKINNTTWIF